MKTINTLMLALVLSPLTAFSQSCDTNDPFTLCDKYMQLYIEYNSCLDQNNLLFEAIDTMSAALIEADRTTEEYKHKFIKIKAKHVALKKKIRHQNN